MTIPYSIYEEKFSGTFRLLKLGSYDVILEADWIYEYSTIGLDLQRRMLTITKNGHHLVFPDFTAPSGKCIVNEMKLCKMYRKGVTGM